MARRVPLGDVRPKGNRRNAVPPSLEGTSTAPHGVVRRHLPRHPVASRLRSVRGHHPALRPGSRCVARHRHATDRSVRVDARPRRGGPRRSHPGPHAVRARPRSAKRIDTTTIPRWITLLARDAWRAGDRFSDGQHAEPDRILRASARPVRNQRGGPFVAIAVADEVELEDKYSTLIAEFVVIAVAAVVLVAFGGWVVTRQSTAPIERSIEHMRRFMADAAHELRTPITVLRSRAEVALQRGRSAEAMRRRCAASTAKQSGSATSLRIYSCSRAQTRANVRSSSGAFSSTMLHSTRPRARG